MPTFVDPRLDSASSREKPAARITTRGNELTDLHVLCREGRLYDVERWIKAGRPLQAAGDASNGRGTSALHIALEAGNHALVLLLLANGYDANTESDSPLNAALRDRRFDLVQLLVEWGADPHGVDLGTLFDTYNSALFDRFRQLGVELTADHALASAIAYHTSNKPLLGFAKRHRLTDPKLQKELDIALAHHAAEGNEKGVQLCLWAGANPHTPVPNLRYGIGLSNEDDNSDDEGRFAGWSAVHEACQRGHSEILKRLGPDPALDDFEDLWQAAGSSSVVELLAQHRLPSNAGAVIQHHLWWVSFGEGWRRVDTLKRLFEVGVRWEHGTPEEISNLRRSLLKTSDQTFVDLMKLFATADYCSSDVLRELARTPSMLARMKKVGFIQSTDERHRYEQVRPTRSREVLERFGVRLPEPKRPKVVSPPVPRSITIGGRAKESKIRLNREELFERVWSKPVDTLAKEWGLSGPGLKKICRRLAIPVPPRGYWAKLKAGKTVRQPKLPALPTGRTEELPTS